MSEISPERMFTRTPRYIMDESDQHPRVIDGKPALCVYCSNRQVKPSQVMNVIGNVWGVLLVPRNELRISCFYYEREPGCDDDTPAPVPMSRDEAQRRKVMPF